MVLPQFFITEKDMAKNATYVFVFENADPIMHMDGLETQPSFMTQATSLEEAIEKAIDSCPYSDSDDPDDYKDDINRGNITVLKPVDQ